MHFLRTISLAVLLLLAAGAGQGGRTEAAETPRFSALLVDQTRLQGQQLHDWHWQGGRPKLDGKPLWDDKVSFYWLRDRRLPPPTALPAAYVEMIGGDRLPGMASEFVSGSTNDYVPLPAHLVVEPVGLYEPPLDPDKRRRNGKSRDDAPTARPDIRVDQRFVRRIVWEGRGEQRYQPGHAFFRDGRWTSFRAARFGSESVSMLTESGQQNASFHDLAELHMPLGDFWSAYCDELTVLSPELKTRLLQVETLSGGCFTSSLDRLAIRPTGTDKEFEKWVHGVQPAWALDVIWAAGDQMWIRRTFAPTELPLGRLYPEKVESQSALAGGPWPWTVNRNLEGGPLVAGGQEFGWGLSVHARSEMTFALPAAAKSFRARVGIDAVAGNGGCIRARVFRGSAAGKPLWESDFLQGGKPPADTGAIPLTGPAEVVRQPLVLQIDPAHDGRPAGADPLDIRDVADWLDPLIELDPGALESEVKQRLGKQFFAWQGWQVRYEGDAGIRWHNIWDEFRHEPDRFTSAVVAVHKPLRLTRELKLGEGDNWLVIGVDRLNRGGGDPPKLEVRIDGELVARHTIPERNAALREPRPLAVSLAAYKPAQGEARIEVELRQVPGRDYAPVDWHSICLKPQQPVLYEALEDQGKFVKLDLEAAGVLSLEAADRYSGARCVKVTAPGSFKLKFASPVPIRARPQFGEYRYLVFAVRKSGKGRVGIELNHADALAMPVRYDGGPGPSVLEKARRFWELDFPDQWVVSNPVRDVYADFGRCDLEGLTLTVPDGKYALFDRVYFARTAQDFDLLPPPVQPQAADREKVLAEQTAAIAERVRHTVVRIEGNGGPPAAGVVIDREGWVLTLGQIAQAPNREFQVRLSGGKTVTGKTAGILRDANLGLIRLSDLKALEAIELSDLAEIPPQELLVGLAAGPARGLTFESGRLEIIQMYTDSFWSTWRPMGYTLGGPAVDHDGKLVGLIRGRTRMHGLSYSKTLPAKAAIERMKKGEVVGRWNSDAAPSFGFVVSFERVDGALRIAKVLEGTSAAAAKLQIGDQLIKVDGRAIPNRFELTDFLSDKMAGQEFAVEIRRSGQTLTPSLKLSHVESSGSGER